MESEGEQEKATLQIKNSRYPTVHSQNCRVYGWLTDIFVYCLSCSFFYHAKLNSIWVCWWLNGLSQM